MGMKSIASSFHLAEKACERAIRLYEECRLTRSRSAELRRQAQDLKARTAVAHDRAAEGFLRTSFVSVLAEPLPERLRNAVTGSPPSNGALNAEAAQLDQPAPRAKENSQRTAREGEEAHDHVDKTLRRAK